MSNQSREIDDIAMQAVAPVWVWVSGFAVNGAAVMYGVFVKKYGTPALLMEGVLGTGLWVAAAMAHAYGQGHPDITLIGALAALWLLIRYPTHWEYTDGC